MVGSPSPSAVLGLCSSLSVDKPSPRAGPDDCQFIQDPSHSMDSGPRRPPAQYLWPEGPEKGLDWSSLGHVPTFGPWFQLSGFGFISHPCPAARSSEGAVRLAQLLRTRLATGRRNSRSTNREGAVQTDRSSSCFLYMFSKNSKRRAGLSSHG